MGAKPITQSLRDATEEVRCALLISWEYGPREDILSVVADAYRGRAG